MQIRINNLPAETTEEEIRELLGNPNAVDTILVTDAGDQNNVVAWLKINGSRAAADAIVKVINQKTWKGRRLQSYAALFVE